MVDGMNRRAFLCGSAAATAGGMMAARASAETQTEESFRTPHGRVREIAHRGYAGRYPENTVAAVREAARFGAEMIEIDVLPCRNGTVVVFHDEDLGRKTDAEGAVVATDCETVTSAEVLNSGQTIPTLRAVMEAVPPETALNIEFKNSGPEGYASFARRVFDITDDYDNTVLVSSFDADAMAACRQVDPSVSLAYLFFDDSGQGLAVARRYDCEAVHPSEGATDRELVCAAHAEDRAVNVYTLTTWQEVEEFRALGVDGVITDYRLTGFGATYEASIPRTTCADGSRRDDGDVFTAGQTNRVDVTVEAPKRATVRDEVPSSWRPLTDAGDPFTVETAGDRTFVVFDERAPAGEETTYTYFVEAPAETGDYAFGPVAVRPDGWSSFSTVPGTTDRNRVVGVSTQS